MEENSMISGAIDKLGEMLSTEEGQKQISDILSAFSGSMDSANENSDTDKEKNNETDSGADFPFSALSGILNSASQKASSDMPDLSQMADMSGIISKLMSGKLTKNNPNSAFLEALKPFLRTERREKVDSAIKIMKFASVFKELGGVFGFKDL